MTSLVCLTPVCSALEPPAPRQDLLSFQYDLYGATQAGLIKEGGVRAVQSAIGQIYFTDYMLRGRSILDAYVEKNWDRFIAHKAVKKSEVRGGRRYISLHLIVDVKKLYADLNEKRFLYRPALRPVFYIFALETYDDEPTTPVGRSRLKEMLDEGQYRYLWEPGYDKPDIPTAEKREVEVAPPMFREDPTVSPAALVAAAEQAQRNEVEVFIAGSIVTRTTRREKVYYDDYTFVETRCSLKLVRADTAEIMASAETVTSAGHIDPAKAVAAAATAAVNDVAPKLAVVFMKEWAKTILRKANVRVMITGVAPQTLDLFRQVLRGVAPDAEVYTRAAYGDVAVLTVSWKGETDELVRLLRETFHPSFRIEVAGPGELILKALSRVGPAARR